MIGQVADGKFLHQTHRSPRADQGPQGRRGRGPEPMPTDHAAVYAYLAELERASHAESAAESRSAPMGVVSGSVGYGAGGPVRLDIARSKRPPSPYELTNAYKNVAYSCGLRLNANGVARVRSACTPRRGPSRPDPTGNAERGRFRSVGSGTCGRYRRSPGSSNRPRGREITNHPLLAAFDSPNDFFDGNGLLQLIARQLDCIGSAYLFPERPLRADGTGDPGQAREGMKLWGLQSQYVYAVKGQGTEVLRSYRYFGDTYARTDLVRIRNVSLRDPYCRRTPRCTRASSRSVSAITT